MPGLKASAIRHCSRVRGPDVFCERCGARQAVERRESAASGSTFGRRLRSAVTGKTADGVSAPSDPSFLRLCLDCRGYSCPNCWNNDVGLCQTCAPLPEPEIFALPDLPVVYADAPVVTPSFDAPTFVQTESEPQPVAWADAQPEAGPEPIAVFEAQPEPDPVVAFEAELEPEPVAAFEAEPEPEPEPVVAFEAEPEPEPVVAFEAELEP